MGTIDDYLAELDDDDRAVIGRVYAVAAETAGETEQGKSYGMPALIHRGKALISVMRANKHIGLYPFSGRVPERVAPLLAGFEHGKGTIRFQPDEPIPDDTIRAIVRARMAEIDDPTLRRRS
ncbi:iron chaperone [Microbacterium sp. NPDC055903]